jgi:ABC-2 type transport system ATP-binding protein
MTAAIEIDGLVERYGETTAVDGLSLAVEQGCLFGLLGPNGSGKSTTINVLCGLISPTAGSASVCGYQIGKDDGAIRQLIGVCPQDPAVYSSLTGRENVELFGRLHLMSEAALQSSAEDLIERLGLDADADRRAGKYSEGMKRRISLIMAVVHDPEVAFLDEPTVGMDPQSRHAVWDLIRELKARGKTVVLTTHYIEEADELCDTVGIIDHGKLIALGSPHDLKDQYSARDLEEVFLQLTGRKIREG